MKKFFEKAKLDWKFKKAGEGQKLNDDSSSSRKPQQQPAVNQQRHVPCKDSQVAGAAALSRIDGDSGTSSKTKHSSSDRPSAGAPSHDGVVGMPGAGVSGAQYSSEAKRAGEAALARLDNRPGSSGVRSKSAAWKTQKQQVYEEMKKEKMISDQQHQVMTGLVEVSQESSPVLSVLGVYYHCPVCPASLTKKEIHSHLHQCLVDQMANNPLMASVAMIASLNKDKDKLKAGVEILCKYIENICKNSTEEKYRKIRIQNKTFQERVATLTGSEQFLQTAGFARQTPEPGGEEFWVLDEESAQDIDRLQTFLVTLKTAEPLKPQLDRSIQVFRPSSHALKFNLPDDFFILTSEEIKKEQLGKTDEVEKHAMLRTKAMKERDEIKEMRKYCYTLIRIRFPDGVILQGTFLVREKLSVLLEFVREQLVNDWQPFLVQSATGQSLTQENKSLEELKLVPAVLLNFRWDPSVAADILASQGSVEQTDFLKPELMLKILSL